MLYLSKTMPKTSNAKYSIFLITAFLVIFINLCTSAPVNVTENAYIKFIAELNRDGCSVPSEIQLPFDTNNTNKFDYLSPYLEICQKTEPTKRNKETLVLCKEIFDNIRNISCSTKTALPYISLKLSKNVCIDFSALKDSVLDDGQSLLKRLTDKFLCDLMCDGEFEKACQVLLWSSEVQKLITSVESSQEAEHAGVLEDVVDIDGKKNIQESKGANEISEHDSITESSELNKKENNPEKKSEKTASHHEDLNQENSVLVDESVIKNHTVPEEENQNLAGALKSSVISLETSSTLLTETRTTGSTTDAKSMKEITKAESDEQSITKQLKADDMNHDKVDVGDSLQSSKATSESDKQTQPGEISLPEGKQIRDAKDKGLSNGHLQDNSNVPLNGEEENEITDEMPQKQNQDKELPRESESKKPAGVATPDLHGNGENPSSIDNIPLQHKLPNTFNDDENLTEKTNTSTTDSQTIKETIQDVTFDKTSVAQEETRKDQTKTAGITHESVTNSVAKNVDQKQPKVSQQTEDSDNTIPETTGTASTSNEKEPEKSQKSKPIAVIPDKNVVPSSPTETSTKTTVVLEKMEGGSDFHQPAEEEGDTYGDLENNEDEYSRPEYDGNLYDGSKNKESSPNVPSPITVAKEVITNQIEKNNDFAPRNSFGQDLSDIQMIGFPEQEDSHFFFYFLSIVLIVMAGYLLFHNKQKIIALIVEGRHERNRRSHRIGYKKLETK